MVVIRVAELLIPSGPVTLEVVIFNLEKLPTEEVNTKLVLCGSSSIPCKVPFEWNTSGTLQGILDEPHIYLS